jgi:hypothetical protein
MNYILMTYVNESGWKNLTKEQQTQGMAAYEAYSEALSKAGVLKGANRLGASSSATTVRTTSGKSQVLDGPFIDVADLDAALAWAARCPASTHGVVEVRPLWTA